MYDIAFPDIDEGIPLPARAVEAMPDLTPFEELEMRSRTIQMLADLTDTPLIPSEADKAQAQELARQMAANPQFQPDYSRFPNEVMACLAELVKQSSFMLVEDLADLKNYVINKLIYEVEYAKTSKDRIAALSKLGDIDGVDAFKKRSEMTIQVKPIEEVERELLNVLENIEYRVLPNAPSEIEANEDETDVNQFVDEVPAESEPSDE
jgi:hypothetical protein